MSLEEFLENYLVPCTEDDDEYEYDDCIYKLDKQKYENNVDKDYPGLKKTDRYFEIILRNNQI